MCHTKHLCLAIGVLLLGIGSARAGGGPENVAVVVNADSWASLAVANEYVALRRIPECNVVYLGNLPSNLSIGVDQFRELILKPVLDTLTQRGLAGQIDCIAYSSDLPYSVHVQSDMGQQKLHKAITPEASINGLTYLYNLVMAKNAGYLSLSVNQYFRRRAKSARDTPWTPQEQEKFSKASHLTHEKKWGEAEPMLRELAAAHPASDLLQYELACCLARLGKGDEAMAVFGRAVDAGWLNVWHAQKDEDLASLRNRPEFKKLLEKMQAAQYEVQPALGFRNATGWTASGEPTSPKQGMRYVLSTMLAMTSGRGNSVREAIESLRRSAAADGTCPQGVIYYLQNGDIRSTTRQWGFASAAKQLKGLGVTAEVVPGVLPQNKPDVAGAMIGAAGFDWKPCGSTILPGAICEHLTSCGGIMREGGGQTPLSELLRHGAAGSSGTVTEPYAIQNKFPTPFLHVFYASGCNLAEAFYQSVYGPYQLLIVGDPLCRPWAKIPRITIEGVASGATVKGTLSIRLKVAREFKISRYEVFLDGRRCAAAQRIGELKMDTAPLSDGYHELRVVAVTADPIETRGNAILPVIVSNRGLSMEVSQQQPLPGSPRPPAGEGQGVRATLDQSITLQAKMPAAKRIVWMHNGRELAATAGPAGSATIPAAKLGLGKVRLQPVAILTDAAGLPPSGIPLPGRAPESSPAAAASPPPKMLAPADVCLGMPLELEILPPKPLAPIKAPPQALAPGLKLSPAGQQPVVVESTREGDWLSKRVKPGQAFALEGFFEAPAEEVYQFQIRASIPVEIAVDGRVVSQPANAGLKYLPVSLAAGMHKLEVKGQAAEKTTLEMHFGGPGALGVSKDRFRHGKL